MWRAAYRVNTEKRKVFKQNSDKPKDSFVRTDDKVELLHKVALEYKMFTQVFSKISVFDVVCSDRALELVALLCKSYSGNSAWACNNKTAHKLKTWSTLLMDGA